MVELDLGKVVMDSYNDLDNKPKINEVELSGNKTLEDLGIQQLIDAVNVSRLSKDIFAPSFETLEDFVVATATDVSVPHFGRMYINTRNWGFGTAQTRYLIAYMRAYTEGVGDVLGNGIFWDDTNTMWHVAIHGSIGNLHIQYYKIEPNQIPTNNLLATEAGTALDAVQGKVLNDLISRMQNLLPLMQVASYGDDDFNNHPVNKIVQVGKSSGILNGPLGATSFYGMSTIIKSYFGYGYQLAVKVGSDAAISGVYIRFNDAKNWGAWKTLVTETELNNILGNYSLNAYAINSNVSHGLYILLGVAGRNGDVDAISTELKNLGFTTMDNTINDLISILTSNGTNKKQQYIRLEVNHNTSNFNKSLPGAKSANVLEIHLQGNGRGYVRCFYLSDATEYTANILNGVIGEWWKTEKTKVQ